MIGRGGMGSVWEAPPRLARHARRAIKFIEAEYANSEEARSRFDKEAKAAATIQSKHAIQIYDHGVTDDGKPYIVMELLTGEPLDKRIERLGPLTLQDTAQILQQVCRGLARAHERGIVHRDLKPENIFIVRNTDDDEEIAKVLDFGIAKIQNSPHTPRRHVEHQDRRRPRHAVLHVARAGARPPQRRSPHRRLVARRHRVQVRDGPASVRR